MRIAHGQRIRAGDAAAADDLHGRQAARQQPVQIGGKPSIIRKRTRTGNDETEHSKHLQSEQRRENPRWAGAAPALFARLHRGAGQSRAALPLVQPLTGVRFCAPPACLWISCAWTQSAHYSTWATGTAETHRARQGPQAAQLQRRISHRFGKHRKGRRASAGGRQSDRCAGGQPVTLTTHSKAKPAPGSRPMAAEGQTGRRPDAGAR